MITSPRKAHLSAITVILALALSFGLLSCSDDNCETCPTCPEVKSSNDIYDGLLYASVSCPWDDNMQGVYIFDMKSEELVDSIVGFAASSPEIEVSPDGTLLAVNDANATTWIYDTRTKEVLASFSLQALYGFLQDGKYLLLHRLKTWIYSVPDFTLLHVDTLDVHWNASSSRARNTFYSIANRRIFYEYSLDSFQIVRSWRPHDDEGMPYDMWSFDMSADEQLLYLICVSPRSCAFVTYDLEADSLINEYPIFSWVGDVCASPVGGDVYVTDPGLPPLDPMGTVYVFDDGTGEYLNGISLYGYREDPRWPLSARCMCMAPDGSQLYVVSDITFLDYGTVFRIDTKTRRIENFLFPQIDRFVDDVAIGPKP